MTPDVLGPDPVAGAAGADERTQLLQDATGFAAELRACESIAAYSQVVHRVLTHPRPGLLFVTVPTDQPDQPDPRLGQVIAATRHRLDPSTVPARPDLPGTRFPRRTR